MKKGRTQLKAHACSNKTKCCFVAVVVVVVVVVVTVYGGNTG